MVAVSWVTSGVYVSTASIGSLLLSVHVASGRRSINDGEVELSFHVGLLRQCFSSPAISLKFVNYRNYFKEAIH